MSEPHPTWHFDQHIPIYGTAPVVWTQTVPEEDAVIVTLSALEIKAIRVAGRVFSFAAPDAEPTTGLRYADVRPILAALAAKLEER